MRYALLLLPILASCSAATPKSEAGAPSAAHAAASVDEKTLTAHHWNLQAAVDRDGKRIDALFARPQRPLRLDFRDGRLGVSNACNRIGSDYRVDDGRLRLGRMMQTLMGCTDPALAGLDEAIRSRLQGAPRLAVEDGGEAPRLRLTTDGGDVLDFVGEPTAETRYGGAGETVFLEIDAQTRPCPHPLIRDKPCLQVRERRYDANGLPAGAPGEWRLLYQDIEGYTHEAGVRNVLRVKRYAVANPPADAPAQAYVLDAVIESERVPPRERSE